MQFEIGQSDAKTAYVRLTDAVNQRYSPPSDVVNKPTAQQTMKLDMCGFELFTQPFAFRFTSSRDGSEYLSTFNQSFVMMDKYMQLDMKLPSRRIYGFGERNREFTLSEGTWTMWANGQETPYDDGTGGKQVYGVHPFALVQTANKGEYIGLYFRNTNAMSPVIRYKDDNSAILSYISVGGQVEIYFFFKGTAKQIISQYQNLVGKPVLPPFWSLGWHAASYGYQTLTDVQTNIDGYSKAGIPLEGIWFDIEYMNKYADFSVDKTAFPDLPTFVSKLHANN